MKTIRFDYTLSNGINDCIYYDEYLEISWKGSYRRYSRNSR